MTGRTTLVIRPRWVRTERGQDVAQEIDAALGVARVFIGRRQALDQQDPGRRAMPAAAAPSTGIVTISPEPLADSQNQLARAVPPKAPPIRPEPTGRERCPWIGPAVLVAATSWRRCPPSPAAKYHTLVAGSSTSRNSRHCPPAGGGVERVVEEEIAQPLLELEMLELLPDLRELHAALERHAELARMGAQFLAHALRPVGRVPRLEECQEAERFGCSGRGRKSARTGRLEVSAGAVAQWPTRRRPTAPAARDPPGET
jgi:hypothetical protein